MVEVAPKEDEVPPELELEPPLEWWVGLSLMAEGAAGMGAGTLALLCTGG